jgi:serine/threonine protein kinase
MMNLGSPVGAGLAYLHHGCSSLIIHRDVKSSNILMNASMEGKMSDFGISKLKSGKNGQEEFATKLIGSAGYLDPE